MADQQHPVRVFFDHLHAHGYTPEADDVRACLDGTDDAAKQRLRDGLDRAKSDGVLNKQTSEWLKNAMALYEAGANYPDPAPYFTEPIEFDAKYFETGLIESAERYSLLSTPSGPTAADVFGPAVSQVTKETFQMSSNPDIRVKKFSERYSKSRNITRHERTKEDIREVETPSELDYAKCGAWFREMARSGGHTLHYSEEEKGLLHEMFSDDTWIGDISTDKSGTLTGQQARDALMMASRTPKQMMTKADLLNDAGSGGLYINPEWFDRNLYMTPLLTGELYPHVTKKTQPNGYTWETAAVGNPTATWGTAEGSSSLSPYDCTGLISQLTGSIFPIAIAIDFGLDLFNDALVDIGRTLTAQCSQRFQQSLDYVVALGDGSTQPTGFMTSSGTAVSSTNGSSGPLSNQDIIALLKAIGKQYRPRGDVRARYVMSDTNWFRFKSLVTGVASDLRLLFGDNDIENYMFYMRNTSVQNDMTKLQAAFVQLSAYWLYQRGGIDARIITGGRTNALANQGTLVVRARFGGKMVDSAAIAQMTDLKELS